MLTWDARGFGKSGGTVQVDHRDYEGRDVQALLDYVAEQPEARLDSPGDPRAGMGGGSYGGAIQLVTAAIDRRVDAIVPLIAWNDLVRSLYQSQTVKAGWGAAADRGREHRHDRRRVQPERARARVDRPAHHDRRGRGDRRRPLLRGVTCAGSRIARRVR